MLGIHLGRDRDPCFPPHKYRTGNTSHWEAGRWEGGGGEGSELGRFGAADVYIARL